MNRTAFLDGIKVISTTELCNRLGMKLSAESIKSFGAAQPYAEMNVGTFWREEDLPLICTSISERVLSVAAAELKQRLVVK